MVNFYEVISSNVAEQIKRRKLSNSMSAFCFGMELPEGRRPGLFYSVAIATMTYAVGMRYLLARSVRSSQRQGVGRHVCDG